MKIIKLKPCPFCGNTNPKLYGNRFDHFFVKCVPDNGEVFCEVKTSDRNCETPEGASDRWNRRII